MKPKLLVVGWDAADFQIVNKLLSEGKLPALARLLEKGVKAPLASLSPMLSPILWTSIATGMRAYQHGITGFTEVSSTGKVRAVRGSSRKIPTYWDILNHYDYKCHTIGWWPSHPTYPSNGIQVSNFYGMAESAKEDWKLWSDSVYPSKMFDELAKYRVHPSEITAEIIKPFFPSAGEINQDDEVLRSVVKITAHAASVHAAATRVMEEDWDVCSVYYDALDHYSHVGMRYFPPKMEGVTDQEFLNYKDIVEAGYRFHDMMLDRLLALAGDSCNVLIISDHGFKHGADRPISLPVLPGAPAIEHHPYGLFVASGPAFKKCDLYGASLLDIAPTILSIFNLPANDLFEGRALSEILVKESRSLTSENYQSLIEPTWKIDEVSSDAGYLKQLQDLGYIHLPDTDEEARFQTEVENAYNLARSLVDGGRWRSALEVLDYWVEPAKNDGRLKHLRAGILLQLGEDQKLINELETWPAEMSVNRTYFKGLIAAKSGDYRTAITTLQSLEDALSQHVEWSVVIARVLREVGAPKDALGFVLKALEIHPLDDNLLYEAAVCAQVLKKWEESLDFALEAANIRPRNWKIHQLIGELLIQLGELKHAFQAFETVFKLNNRSIIAKRNLLQLATQLGYSINKLWSESEVITVVSGLPRSGTSLIMQMLNAAGVPVYTDHSRLSDVNNPHGYFEAEEVKDLMIDSTFLEKTQGKAVKVVVPLLQQLPHRFQYRIIYIDRPIPEVILSQEIMKGQSREMALKNFPYHLGIEFDRLRREAIHWMDRHQLEYELIDYQDLQSNLEEVVTRLCKFLSIEGMEEKMKSAVDHNLFRTRLN